MARDRSPIVKQSRREGFALHVKAHRYLARKAGGPGQHGGRGRRFRGQGQRSQYAIQLREKQKIRRLYGLLEKQFRNLFHKAQSQPGPTGNNLLVLLERRLDNVVYRAGFAVSRRGARQIVSHKHFDLNGRRVNIASISLKIGDVLSLRPKSQKNDYFQNLNTYSPAVDVPEWLQVDRGKFRIEVVGWPDPEAVSDGLNPQLLVEYYSR